VQPGVLTVEMLAQAGAVCVLSLPEFKGRVALFAGIDKARFRRTVRPGDTLELTVEILKLRSSIGVGSAVATVDGKRAVTAEISFAIGPAAAGGGRQA
jgi:3-hydroxyacyl-[acyl-carrier-protein] dehydratase